jgi:transcriptional regulator with XRE-family HTH domain
MQQLKQAPFSEALKTLMEEQDLTYRQLEERTKRDTAIEKTRAKGLSNVSINMLATGRLAPTVESMEILARALLTDPEVFLDYRLAVIRTGLDPKIVGYENARKLLASLEQGRYI